MLSSSFTLPLLFVLIISTSSFTIKKKTQDLPPKINPEDLKNDVECTPFGVRVQYGQYLINQNSKNKISISFNTPQNCPNSFLRILSISGFLEIPCNPDTINTTTMNGYKAFVQRCDIYGQVSFNKEFYYTVFGWNTSSGFQPTPNNPNWIKMNIPDPKNHKQALNIMILADWGASYNTGFIPIHSTLRTLMLQKKIDLMIVAGDIAYNLNSAQGARYQQFLKFAEQIMNQIPCIFIPGNHDDYSDDDKILLNSTFLAYNITNNKAFGFPFGDTFILPYDPYYSLYELQRQEQDDSLQRLQQQLDIAKQTNLSIIPISHYPVNCNGQLTRCGFQSGILWEHHKAMFEAGVNLHFGAHAHEYNRIYPYFKTQKYKAIESPYYDDQEYIISIVEGVAGSNTDMVLQMPYVYDFTASYTVNQTGFGILTVNANSELKFEHYSTTAGKVDEMVIKKVRNKEQRK